jgi:hypothetical protein
MDKQSKKKGLDPTPKLIPVPEAPKKPHNIREIKVEFQPIISHPPISQQDAHSQSCSNDDATMAYWKNTWLTNIKKNKETYGSFAEHSAGILWGTAQQKPTIIAGSGPSLKYTAPKFKDRPDDMLLVSCLHNFHFLEDLDARVDYYVTLDAGPITIGEVSEGGKRSEEEYWDLTITKTLIAFIGTDPGLLSKWQGKILFYNAPIPSEEMMREIDSVEKFGVYIESGGCVLGTSMFFAKGILGSQTLIFTGADFSFSQEYNPRFHAWDSKYDTNQGECIKALDVFGNCVKTWRSYYGFKLWFDLVAQKVPGIYINASEGGILGAYREGNISAIKQMWYDDMIDLFSLHKHKKEHCLNPAIDKMFAVYI